MASNTEKTNYIRLLRLLIDVGSDVLRTVFKERFPSVSKYGHILQLQKDKIYHRLNKEQKMILFPYGRDYKGNLSDLDISVLYILLRNIANLPKPSSCDWGEDPYELDRSMSANIERIRMVRNIFAGHITTAAISETKFQIIWKTLKQALVELGAEERLIDEMLVSPIDPNTEEYYNEQIKSLLAVSEKVDEMGEKVEKVVQTVTSLQQETEQNVKSLQQETEETTKRVTSLEGDVSKLKVNQEIGRKEQENLTELQDKELQRWKEKLRKFVVTESAKNVLQKLRENQVVVLRGSSGSGKTTTAFYVASLFESDEGYAISCGKHPRDILILSDLNKRQIFILDDVFGKTDLNAYSVDEWESCCNMIRGLLENNQNLRLLFVYRTGFNVNNILKSISVTKYAECFIELTLKEKRLIGNVYLPQEIMEMLDDKTLQMYPFLPYLFEIYSSRTDTNPRRFFRSPDEVIHEELEGMYTRSSPKCTALVLLVLLNNNVDKQIFKIGSTVHNETLNCIHEESTFGHISSRQVLLKHFKLLQNSYVIETPNSFIAIHDRMFGIMAKWFGQRFPFSVLKHGAPRLLCDRVMIESFLNPGPYPEIIILGEEHKIEYFESMVIELTAEDYRHVFGSNQSQSISFRKEFVSFLTNSDKLHLFQSNSSVFHVLILSCAYGYLEYVEFILNYNTTSNKEECLNMKSNFRGKGWTPLHISCCFGYKTVANFLLEYGAIVNVEDNTKCTALHLACKNDHSDIAELLLKKGASVDYQDRSGYTPLHLACSNAYMDVAEVLLTNGAAINKTTKNGSSALHIACGGMQTETEILNPDSLPVVSVIIDTFFVNYLLENQAKVNLSTLDGLTPLHLICYWDHEELARTLLTYGADINVASVNGLTPLHVACRWRKLRMVKLLLDCGAKITVYCSLGYTPLSLACKHGFRNVAILLLKYLRQQ